MVFLKFDEETVNKIAARLDPDSMEILWYLWQKKHARIEELAELIDAPTHMDVLIKIKEIINPTAKKIAGHSVLVFERSKVDPENGEKILFSWWVVGEGQRSRIGRRSSILDVFDEGDYITVIAELPGVQEEDIDLKVEKNRLIVSANTSDKNFCEDVSLPAEVDPMKFIKKYNNSILKVRLEKMTWFIAVLCYA